MATGQTGRFINASSFDALVRDAILNNRAGVLDAITGLVGNSRVVTQNSDGTWPTITRRTWLYYRWVPKYDSSKQPTLANGAQPGDEYAGYDTSFLPSNLA